jgi:hypothetical protein
MKFNKLIYFITVLSILLGTECVSLQNKNDKAMTHDNTKEQNRIAKAFFRENATEKERKIVEHFITSTPEDITVQPPANRLQNELWSCGDGSPVAARGQFHFFARTGYYAYNSYYSGGMYGAYSEEGIYEYNDDLKEITLHRKNSENTGFPIPLPKTPDKISALPINNDSVTTVNNSIKLAEKYRMEERREIGKFFLNGQAIEPDSITLNASINGKPFCAVVIEKQDFATILDLLNVIQPTDTAKKNTIRLEFAVYSNRYNSPDKITIETTADFMKQKNLKFGIDNNDYYIRQATKRIIAYVSE